jgi:cobalt/nickel transport system permease protein
MHIPDGFLSPEVAAGSAVIAAGAVGIGLRRAEARLDDRLIPLLGVTGAFVFAAQMLNFPVAGGTSGHFLGAALATILLGPWLACLVLAVVLATQSFVFADGGVSALGANVLNMGVLGALATGGLMLAARRVLPRRRGMLLGVAGAGAWLAVVAGAAGTSASLALSGTVPLGTVLPAMLAVHVVIGVGEAIVTVAALSALMATRPDLIGGWAPAEARAPRILAMPQGA